MNLKILMFAALAALSLTACAGSRNPIAPLNAAIPTPELIGTWATAPADEQIYGCTDITAHLHIYPLDTPDKNKIELLVVVANVKAPEKVGWYALDGYATRLSNGPFLNLQVVALGPQGGASEGEKAFFEKALNEQYYFFTPYEVSRVGATPRIRLSYTIGEQLYNAGDAGKLAYDKKNQVIVASSDDIARYLSSLNESDPLSISCVFERIE